MENDGFKGTGMLLRIVGLIEAGSAFYTFIHMSSELNAFWSNNAFLIFFFSLLELFIVIAMRGERKFSFSNDVLFLILLSGLFMPFLMMGMLAKVSAWLPLFIIVFYAFIVPILFFLIPTYSQKSIFSRGATWLDYLMVLIALYLLVASIMSVPAHMVAEVDFSNSGDNYIENMDDSHVIVHITLVNKGLNDATGIELKYNGSVVYRASILRGLSSETWVFTMFCRGEPHIEPYYEAVYGEDGNITYVRRNVTRYYPVQYVDIQLVYHGKEIGTMRLFQTDYYYGDVECDTISVGFIALGAAPVSQKRRRSCPR